MRTRTYPQSKSWKKRSNLGERLFFLLLMLLTRTTRRSQSHFFPYRCVNSVAIPPPLSRKKGMLYLTINHRNKIRYKQALLQRQSKPSPNLYIHARRVTRTDAGNVNGDSSAPFTHARTRARTRTYTRTYDFFFLLRVMERVLAVDYGK